MDPQKKKILYIVVAVLVIFGAFYLLQGKASQSGTESENATTTTDVLSQSESPVTANTISNEPLSENPGDQGDVTNQPAYLVSAYTDHGVNTIGVDYVLVFQGEDSKQAQIEDGLCSQESECQINPNGYIRNNNPHFRTYKVSTTSPLAIEVSGALQSMFAGKGINTSTLSFDNLKEILPTMPQFVPSAFPYKEAKTFVYITIKDGAVTKIHEPSR